MIEHKLAHLPNIQIWHTAGPIRVRAEAVLVDATRSHFINSMCTSLVQNSFYYCYSTCYTCTCT